jgi:hypothetical protein
MANARKKQFKLPKPAVPRAMDLIEQDYGRIIAQTGQAQYQVHVYTEDLKRMNEELRSLNYEAAARKKLDKEEADKAAPKTEEPKKEETNV